MLKCVVLIEESKLFWARHVSGGICPQAVTHLFLRQRHHSATSRKDPFSWRFCLCCSGWCETKYGAPEVCSSQSSAPYLCVSCFLGSAFSRRAWFPRQQFPLSVLPQMQDSPLGRGRHGLSPQTPAQWNVCSKEILFSFQNGDLWGAAARWVPRGQDDKTEGWGQGSSGAPECGPGGCYYWYPAPREWYQGGSAEMALPNPAFGSWCLFSWLLEGFGVPQIPRYTWNLRMLAYLQIKFCRYVG